jgi:hypothetical protein
LQQELMRNPEAGEIIQETGGLRKMGLRTGGAERASAAGFA